MWTYVLIYLGKCLGIDRIARSYGEFIFNFIKNHQLRVASPKKIKLNFKKEKKPPISLLLYLNFFLFNLIFSSRKTIYAYVGSPSTAFSPFTIFSLILFNLYFHFIVLSFLIPILRFVTVFSSISSHSFLVALSWTQDF